MRAIIERIGPCRMQFGPPEFHSLAESIVYQQLNGRAAETIFNRFAALAGDPLTPQGILKLSDEQMRAAGPVSYTHLDVYKRQRIRRCVPTTSTSPATKRRRKNMSANSPPANLSAPGD